MPTLIYSMSVSLDGYIAGRDGDIGWAAPDEELMRFHNQQTEEIGAHLCGRGLYEDMLPWESAEETRTDSADLEFARIWKAIPKVVFSSTLNRVEGDARLAKGSIAQEAAEIATLPGKDVVSVGGAGLAASFVELDLIDEYRLFVNPIVLGAGSPYLPRLSGGLDLELLESRTFGSRVVYLRYRRVEHQPGTTG